MSNFTTTIAAHVLGHLAACTSILLGGLAPRLAHPRRPARVAGFVACERFDDESEVAWTDEANLLLVTAQASMTKTFRASTSGGSESPELRRLLD
jgi:hypothetical protein